MKPGADLPLLSLMRSRPATGIKRGVQSNREHRRTNYDVPETLRTRQCICAQFQIPSRWRSGKQRRQVRHAKAFSKPFNHPQGKETYSLPPMLNALFVGGIEE